MRGEGRPHPTACEVGRTNSRSAELRLTLEAVSSRCLSKERKMVVLLLFKWSTLKGWLRKYQIRNLVHVVSIVLQRSRLNSLVFFTIWLDRDENCQVYF